jgi:hypothetical protein
MKAAGKDLEHQRQGEESSKGEFRDSNSNGTKTYAKL